MTDQRTNHEELQHRERGSHGGCLVLGFMLLFVVYVLSPPAVMLLLDVIPGGMSHYVMTAAQVIYYPLEAAYEEIPWVKAFYDWYFELIGVR